MVDNSNVKDSEFFPIEVNWSRKSTNLPYSSLKSRTLRKV